jgi:Protein of unknown function
MDDGEATERLDDFLSEEERGLVDALSATEVEAIDAAILARAREDWLKVAFIVGSLWTEFRRVDDRFVPLGFLVRRVAWLVELGKLESQGDMRRMRYGEVRLPGRRLRLV